jgi:hypothetical protein|tara:strand:- start:10674 stop:11030 length:357 start_codon:yes stop_codon:yes gene_type:complete
MDSKDNQGFITPLSPSHSLQLLNKYLRTTLVIFIHGAVKEFTKEYPKLSPLEHLINGIAHTLIRFKDADKYDVFEANPISSEPRFKRNPEEDFKHDLKLMLFQLKELRATLKSTSLDD